MPPPTTSTSNGSEETGGVRGGTPLTRRMLGATLHSRGGSSGRRPAHSVAELDAARRRGGDVRAFRRDAGGGEGGGLAANRGRALPASADISGIDNRLTHVEHGRVLDLVAVGAVDRGPELGVAQGTSCAMTERVWPRFTTYWEPVVAVGFPQRAASAPSPQEPPRSASEKPKRSLDSCPSGAPCAPGAAPAPSAGPARPSDGALHEQILPALGLREGDHVSQAVGPHQQHHHTIVPESEAAVGRGSGVERVEQEPEAGPRPPPSSSPSTSSMATLHVASVVSQAARAQLDAVQDRHRSESPAPPSDRSRAWGGPRRGSATKGMVHIR